MDHDNIVGILQIERQAFKGEGDVGIVIDAELALLRTALVDFAQQERDRGKLPA
jgi:predicted metal-dependent HD superfamily phosphohydrolase